MQKLLALKKDYEREGFHLQRLYKRRTRDEDGVWRSTMNIIMEPVKRSSKSAPAASKSNSCCEEVLKKSMEYTDQTAEKVVEYIESTFDWNDFPQEEGEGG